MGVVNVEFFQRGLIEKSPSSQHSHFRTENSGCMIDEKWLPGKMLSRSSSAYQPLGGGNSRTTASANDEDEETKGTEMTSIAIISQHPFRNSNSHAPMISTVSGGPAPELDDYSLCNTSEGEEKETGGWTNFHFVMCVGIVGFFVFWIILLCRMYLPPEYQFWGPGIKPKV